MIWAAIVVWPIKQVSASYFNFEEMLIFDGENEGAVLL
jgi:hypothetical protein